MTRARAVVVLSSLIALVLGAPARAAAPLPEDLVGLEGAMAQLHANSVRFTFQTELELPGLSGLLGSSGGSGESAPLVFVIAGRGEAGTTPPEFTASAGLFGAPQEHVLQIGETLYTYNASAGHIDGHRPWVRSHGKSGQLTESGALDPGGLLENDHAGSQGTFSGLIAELNGALSITESGPATVDDQRVTEFDAELDPTPLVEKLRAKSSTPGGSSGEGNPLSGLGELTGPPPKQPAKAPAPPTLELEVFIAPSGLPVRSRVTASIEGVHFAERVDTLAIDIPVSVQAPPASETIDKAALEAIERRRSRRERAAMLRACRQANLHRKRKLLCGRFIRVSRPPASSTLRRQK